jgi:hypothetical protein
VLGTVRADRCGRYAKERGVNLEITRTSQFALRLALDWPTLPLIVVVPRCSPTASQVSHSTRVTTLVAPAPEIARSLLLLPRAGTLSRMKRTPIVSGAALLALVIKTPDGPARTVFPTAPRSVYARFALRGVKRGALVTIVFRDTDGRSVVSHARSRGTRLTWYSARVAQERLQERLGYWSVAVRVGTRLLGQIHFLIPAGYPTVARGGRASS